MREALIDAGLQLIERDGVAALSARNVAAAAGTSTMAVYTHFNGMTGLLDAVAGEAFHRFALALTEIAHTDDPVADFCVMGAAYHRFALADPQRYQLMFGTTSPASIAAARADLTVAGAASDRTEWGVSFEALRTAVSRMIDAGRIRDDGELVIAGRLWSIVHGQVLLEMAGFFGHDGRGLTQILAPAILDTLVGMGDDRDAATQSLLAATAAIGATDLAGH